MNLNLQGRHVFITPALNEYVKTKLKKVKSHFDHLIHVHVVLEVQKGEHIAEVTISAEHHHFHNKVKSGDMYKSIDFVFDKIDTQVVRYKEFLVDKKKRATKSVAETEMLEFEKVLEKNKWSVDIQEVVACDKPMDILEALLQLQALDHQSPFLVFFQRENEKTLSYLLRGKEEKEFLMITFDHIWELHQLRLIDHNRFETVSIESLRPSTETLEDAVDYLFSHQEKSYRFFISASTHESALLFHHKGNHFHLA